jgi:hypothetical protein
LTPTTAAIPADLTPGESRAYPEVPGYEVLGILGHGGMGVVYRARQLKANRLVALKMIRSVEHASPTDRLRFQIETEAVARLQHPHIVQLYEAGEVRGLPFFSLELCDGGSLTEQLRKRRPTEARPAGRLERAVKWAKRRPALAGLLGVTVLGLVALAVLSANLAVARSDAEAKAQEARQEADKAKKAREFLVSIFQKAERDVKGGNVTVRQLLDEAETRIPVEFGDQPALRGELISEIGKVRRGIARRTPQAMLLEVRGAVQLQSADGEPKKVRPQTLVNLDDRLSLSADAQVQVVFLSDLHKERLKAGREVTIDSKGCEPADAVLERDDGVPMTFVRLPKGTFYMGWDGVKKGVKTEIKEDFEIAVHDVTQGQWQAVMDANVPAGKAAKGKWLERSTRVGAYPPNKLGLCDMHGNVWQWCEDAIDKLGSTRVYRGGGWNTVGPNCRAAIRSWITRTSRPYMIGFRLARVPRPAPHCCVGPTGRARPGRQRSGPGQRGRRWPARGGFVPPRASGSLGESGVTTREAIPGLLGTQGLACHEHETRSLRQRHERQVRNGLSGKGLHRQGRPARILGIVEGGRSDSGKSGRQPCGLRGEDDDS